MNFTHQELKKYIEGINDDELEQLRYLIEIEKMKRELFVQQTYFPENITKSLQYIGDMVYSGKIKIKSIEEGDIWKYVEDGLSFTIIISFQDFAHEMKIIFSEWDECIDGEHHIHYHVDMDDMFVSGRILNNSEFNNSFSYVADCHNVEKMGGVLQSIFKTDPSDVLQCLFGSFLGKRYNPTLFNIF